MQWIVNTANHMQIRISLQITCNTVRLQITCRKTIVTNHMQRIIQTADRRKGSVANHMQKRLHCSLIASNMQRKIANMVALALTDPSMTAVSWTKPGQEIKGIKLSSQCGFPHRLCMAWETQVCRYQAASGTTADPKHCINRHTTKRSRTIYPSNKH